jgi:Domain of unknown function (DUF4365)
MPLPPRKVTGRMGMNFVERVALAAEAKLITIPEDLDTGVDGLVEFEQPDHTVSLVAVQVKRGSSYFDKSGAKCATDARHMRYWMNYAVPVILVVVNDDETEAYWMDVRQHLRDHPSVAHDGPFTLHPPQNQRFTSDALVKVIRRLASVNDFGQAVVALSDPLVETRLSALSLLYRFRMERRALFCLAAALRVELDADAIRLQCDFYSRYLSHPEMTFGADSLLRKYAQDLLTDASRGQLVRLLQAFNDDEHYGDWSGATELFAFGNDEIPDRHAIIERVTLQQGIAEVVAAAASTELLLEVALDSNVPVNERRAAVALFGYLGYECPLQKLDDAVASEPDPALNALLRWVRYWLAQDDG